MRYIIKNCECFYLNACCGTNTNRLYCKDITRCVMKQIVAEEININDEDAPTNAYAMGRAVVAEKILELLEIEEVDEM